MLDAARLVVIQTELFSIAPSDAMARVYPLARRVDKVVDRPLGLDTSATAQPER